MRVDLRIHGTDAAEQSTTERARGKSGSSDSGSASASSLDEARFSFDPTRIRNLENHVIAQPEVRQEKVDSLRQTLGKGEYSVSDGQIADAIFADLANGSAAQLTG